LKSVENYALGAKKTAIGNYSSLKTYSNSNAKKWAYTSNSSLENNVSLDIDFAQTGFSKVFDKKLKLLENGKINESIKEKSLSKKSNKSGDNKSQKSKNSRNNYIFKDLENILSLNSCGFVSDEEKSGAENITSSSNFEENNESYMYVSNQMKD